MKNIASLIITIVLVLTVGSVYAGELNKGLSNGITDFEDFNGSWKQAIEGSPSCGGASTGGVSVSMQDIGNGATYFSTGAAIFDSGPVGPDTGGACVKTLPQRANEGRWPEDYS